MTGEGDTGGLGPAETFGTCSCRSEDVGVVDGDPSGTLLEGIAALLVAAALVVVVEAAWFSFITECPGGGVDPTTAGTW